MVRRLKALLLLFIVVAAYSCKENKSNEIPINEFFKIPEKTSFKISPDGKYVSYLKKYNQKQNIFIQSLADGKEVVGTSFTDYAVRGDYMWTYDNQIIFGQDNPGDDHHMFVLDINTLKTKPILSAGKARIRILNKSRLTPDVITIAMNKRDSANFDVYSLNVKSGELKTYLVNPGNITEWLSDNDGKIRLVKASDGVDETILYRANDRLPFKAIIKNNFRNYVRPIAFTGEKKYFYALSNIGRDKTAFVVINAENGKEEREIYANDNVDVQRVDYSQNKSRLELVAWDEARPQKYFLNADVKTLYTDLTKKLGDQEINIAEKDSAENKFIVTTYTDRSRGSVYLYERTGDKLTKLTDNSTINPDELCAKKPISYVAGDGVVINGYITLPLGGTTNLPVVVMPHDGPFGMRDSWGYNSEVQFLANRGYAVLQVNYRGSAGYGKVFYSAGFKEVGGKIQQDITDGVNWLITNKIANPKKIAIYGHGFGGFSALYGISFNPKLYNCAVVQNGLINFFTYVKTAPAFYKPVLQKMYATIGDPEKDADALRAISPVFHPDMPKVPLIFLQDYKDQRANISEVNHYIRELQKRNVPVKYSLNKNDRGSLGGENKRMQNYADIERFLDSNMHVKP